MSTFRQRIKRGRESESAFEKFCKMMKLNVVFVSTHRDNPRKSVTRHFPDYYVVEWASFVQVKDGKNSTPYPNVIAEKKSIDACMELYKHGANVLVVWRMPDGKFLGNLINDLDIVGEISDDARMNGSGTLAYKISKSNLIDCEVLEFDS